MQKWKTILSSNLFLGIFLLLGCFYLIYIVINNRYSFFNSNETKIVGTIVKIRERENNTELFLKIDSKRKLRVFIKKKNDLKIGDQIKIEGEFKEPIRNTIPNGFNYKHYLWYHQENIYFKSEKEEKIGESKNIFLKIKRNLIEKIENRKNRKYLKIFILGDTEELTVDEKNSLKVNGINHLFSISGMHISLIIGIITIFIRKRKSFLSWTIINIILFGYLTLIDFLPSACRAFVLWNFITLSKIQNLNFTKIKCFLWMLGTILFIKPFFIFEVGFQFSMTLCFFFCLIERKLSEKTKLKQMILISTLALFVSLPITLYYYYEINFLSILWNILIVPFITIFFFPLQLLSLIIPILSIPAYYLGEIFEVITQILEKIDFLIMTFHKPSILWIITYYLLLILMLKKKNKKRCVLMIVILIIYLYHYNLIVRKSYFLMIDVGQGDSMLIHSNNKTMLLDTGGTLNKSTIAEKKILPLLKSLGIRKINVLCLSHGDTDHLGEAIKIIENIKVDKIYFNANSINEKEIKIANVAKKKNIPLTQIKERDYFNIGNFSFFSLNHDLKLENPSSIVLLGKIDKFFFLLAGDSTVETEKYILSQYKIPRLLFLKVAHHGSKTSTSTNLLEMVRPKYSLISVGKNNLYHHPDFEVVERLEEYSENVYSTSIYGSIFIKFKKNVTFKYYAP